MPYAVVQDGYAIFGVGSTEAEAIKDARHWSSDPDEFKDLPDRPNFAGDMYVTECTAALAATVKVNGGQVAHTLRDGVVYLDDELDGK